MSLDTKELIDRIQPERVSRLRKQISTLALPYQGQGQGQVRSRIVITNYLFNQCVQCAAHDAWAILFI